MGIYLNPDNSKFFQVINSSVYVDKSQLISFTNERINTEQRYICVSRPRRFGKSVNLAMLSAYYSKGCKSKKIFNDLSIANDTTYFKHLNKYNVIYINMQDFWTGSNDIEDMLQRLEKQIFNELTEEKPDINLDPDDNLNFWMEDFYIATKRKKPFVILIDEWDCVMHEEVNSIKVYLDFLRGWLKDKDYIALTYMTGILPIKKLSTQSSLNMFDEYSMLSSTGTEKYTGFTNEEVSNLCQKYNIDFEKIKFWYGGYNLNGTELYCSHSVVNAILSKQFDGYQTEVKKYETLVKYITMNFEGLHDTIEKLFAKQSQPVNTQTFSNDMITFKNKDDIMTLLVHLGYLGYNDYNHTVYIPNEETFNEFLINMESNNL